MANVFFYFMNRINVLFLIFIVKNKECTGNLKHKRPETPWEIIKVNDHKIISIMRKNPYITSYQVNNTLEEVGI